MMKELLITNQLDINSGFIFNPGREGMQCLPRAFLLYYRKNKRTLSTFQA